MSKYQYNLVVIGGGSAGLVCSLIAARAGAKVALIEEERMGGECLYTGCVPSKTLIASAKVTHQVRVASQFGIHTSPPTIDFKAIMARVRKVIADIEPHDSRERYERMGVECIQAHATMLSPHRIQVNNIELSARTVILATGSSPILPPIEGLSESAYLTSDTIWNLTTLPERLTVLGGGAIGCELAQAFSRLGSRVTVIEREATLVPLEDRATSDFLKGHFEKESIRVLTNSEVIKANNTSVHVRSKGETTTVPHDVLLVAVGRRPQTDYLNPNSNNIELNRNGTVTVNQYLQTTSNTVFACGDVAGPYQFTHTAAHQALCATINALARPFYRTKYQSSVIPFVVFTDPEISRVGFTEQEARIRFKDVVVTVQPIANNDRSRTEGIEDGFVKVLTRGSSDAIIGATIIAPNAGDLIQNLVAAVSRDDGLKAFSTSIYPYPTITESIGQVARNWRQRDISPGITNFSKRVLEFLR